MQYPTVSDEEQAKFAEFAAQLNGSRAVD
jgi:hypothetical protein